MITVRSSLQRGKEQRNWLDSRHTFSFGNYHNPEYMGFRSLRVINEDFIQPCTGFPSHGHSDMEIITYVIEGTVEHKDSLNSHTTIKSGEIQCMSAGAGIIHSEYNPSKAEILHLLQIWILPNKSSSEPNYQQRKIYLESNINKMTLIVSDNGEKDTLLIQQDVNIYASQLSFEETVIHEMSVSRYGWIQVIQGRISINSIPLEAGDGAAISQETSLEIRGTKQNNEFLFFDLK
jgi:hypothetical protein